MLARIFLLLALLLVAGRGYAVQPSERLADPVLEARARTLSSSLRCLVCQNETIDESDAGLAHDIRMLLRERLTAGDTDQQAVRAIVDRYGEFVLLNPPLHPATTLLWFGPFAILLAGLTGAAFWVRQRRKEPETLAPLSTEERRELQSLMQENER